MINESDDKIIDMISDFSYYIHTALFLSIWDLIRWMEKMKEKEYD